METISSVPISPSAPPIIFILILALSLFNVSVAIAVKFTVKGSLNPSPLSMIKSVVIVPSRLSSTTIVGTITIFGTELASIVNNSELSRSNNLAVTFIVIIFSKVATSFTTNDGISATDSTKIVTVAMLETFFPSLAT